MMQALQRRHQLVCLVGSYSVGANSCEYIPRLIFSGGRPLLLRHHPRQGPCGESEAVRTLPPDETLEF